MMTTYEALMLCFSFATLMLAVVAMNNKKNNPPLIVGLWVDYELFTYSVCRSPLKVKGFVLLRELPTTYASLRGWGFKRLVCVR